MNQMELEKKWIKRDTTEIPIQIRERYPEMAFRWKRYNSSVVNIAKGNGMSVVLMPPEEFTTVVDPVRSTINDGKDVKGMKKNIRGFVNPATGGGQVGTEIRNGDLILMMMPKKMAKERDETLYNYTKRRGSNRSLDAFKSTGEQVASQMRTNVPTHVTHDRTTSK